MFTHLDFLGPGHEIVPYEWGQYPVPLRWIHYSINRIFYRSGLIAHILACNLYLVPRSFSIKAAKVVNQ
jgi:hypothetical protein